MDNITKITKDFTIKGFDTTITTALEYRSRMLNANNMDEIRVISQEYEREIVEKQLFLLKNMRQEMEEIDKAESIDKSKWN